MTPLRFATAMTVLLVCTSVASAEGLQLAGAARDPGVKRWIWYQIIGPRNHPLPIVYISTQSFKRMADEFLIVLPLAKYQVVSAYTQARIARTDCPGEKPRGDIWNTVEIAVHGHFDHFGGLVGFLRKYHSRLKARLPLHIGGEDCFCSREWAGPPARGDFGALDRKALKEANLVVTYAAGLSRVADHAGQRHNRIDR